MMDEHEILHRIAREVRAVWTLDRSPSDAIAAIDMILAEAGEGALQIELADAERLARSPAERRR